MPDQSETISLAASIASVLDIDAIFRRAGALAEEVMGAEAASIMLIDEERGGLFCKAVTGDKAAVVHKLRFALGEGIAGTVAQTGKPILALDALSHPQFNAAVDRLTGFTTKQVICVPLLQDNAPIGVLEILNSRSGLPFTADDMEKARSLAALFAAQVVNARFAEDHRNFFSHALELFVAAIESRDQHLPGHSWKVAQLATTIGQRMGITGDEYRDLYYGSLLHDIGILSVSGSVSLVEGVFMNGHAVEMSHPRLGADLVRNIALLRGAEGVIRHHHENYDGTGYPDGLTGEAIPLGARITAVAEAVEEMRISHIPGDRIRQMLKIGQETRFDPQIVCVYLKEFPETN